MKTKHEKPIFYCAHCDYNSLYKSSVIKHMNTVHTPQQAMFQCCCTSNDECGTRRHGMTGDEVRTLINHSFHVFQNYMKIIADGATFYPIVFQAEHSLFVLCYEKDNLL